MITLTSEIDQLQKAHDKVVEAQYQEIEKQYKYFIIEIETFKES